MAQARRWRRLPEVIRWEIIRLAADGWTYREIQAHLRLSPGPVIRVLVPMGGVIRHEEVRQRRCPHRLSLDDRIEIYAGIKQGRTLRAIGSRVGRAGSTVCREIAHNGGRDAYRPMAAQRRAARLARRPKTTKLAANPVLCRRVIHDLERLWSPQQIQARLLAEFGDDPAMQLSHETIYKSLYVQGRGELRKELTACLRTGRAARKRRGRVERPRIKDMVMISQRPAEVADRAVPGHWEGDLIIGKDGNSAIGTLVERTTRFVMLLHLPVDRTAAQVRDAMQREILTLPAALRRSVTWDQGIEMAQHLRFTLDTGIAVYFCDPHAPWQRGSNENTNGLLRQYFPKGTDLSQHDVDDLAAVADSLNGRPRKTLDWKTPAEKLTELLVAHTG